MRKLSEMGLALAMVLISVITAVGFLLLSASFAGADDIVAVRHPPSDYGRALPRMRTGL